MSVSTSCICHAWKRPAKDHAPSCPQASSPLRPAAPAAGADLREQMAEWMRTHLFWGLDPSRAPEAVDALLALPALRSLVEQAAEAARLWEVMERLLAYLSIGTSNEQAIGRDLRRALDGEAAQE